MYYRYRETDKLLSRQQDEYSRKAAAERLVKVAAKVKAAKAAAKGAKA
jgi:hypothetical protein